MAPRERTLQDLGLREATLVHYDVGDGRSAAKTALHRFLSGRTVRKGGKLYRYMGLVSEGAFRFGQSVFLLDPDVADRLIRKLQELRIPYSARTIFVE